MRRIQNGLLLIFTIWLAVGCIYNPLSMSDYGPASMIDPKEPDPETGLDNKLHEESAKLTTRQKKIIESIEKQPKQTISVDPIMPSYNPLDDFIVSFSMIDEDLQLVLYSLTQAVGANFIIDPEIESKNKKITMNFENVTASAVLTELMNIYDFYYTIDENIIRIKPFQEKIYNLDFLDTNVTTSFEIGGDVLGAGESSGVTGLAGNFKLSGKGAAKGNPYDTLENIIRPMISRTGKYSLNRLSGTLYVRDTPQAIASLSKIINHYKKIMARQIHIEARIIEVTLNDKYKYGIDWSVVRIENEGKQWLTNANFSVENGLVLNGTSNDLAFGPLNDRFIEALNTFGETKVVSNPSISAKHGQPAIISVGTSITYKKSEKTTSTTSTTTTSDKTIEVSTVFDGLILGVIPFINEDDTISILINPIKSDVDRTSLELVGTISLPEVNIKELSTTISLNNKDIVVLGGLIDKRHSVENKGVPFLSSIPFLGYFFKSESTIEENRELVIILSVSII